MEEYIVFYENTFFRFSVDKLGLCVQKMENNRFSEKQILLTDAKEDFCAMAEDIVYVVCQSVSGSIICFMYDGKMWKKTVLLESREGRAYRKYFKLVKLGNLANLFYTIKHEDKTMLIHQILDGKYSQPEVVDFVMPCGVRFCIAEHISSDLSITYKNQDGVCGSKIYRWSHKSFMPFVPFTENTEFEPHCINITDVETQMIGYEDKKGEKQVVFYYKDDFGESIKHELGACYETQSPVIFEYKGKTIVQWVDRGCIMSAISDNGGQSFSPPVKYIKNTYSDILLFVICSIYKKCLCYGLNSKSGITFYSAKDILDEIKSDKKRVKSAVSGSDAAVFAARSGYKKTSGWDDDPYVTQKELRLEIEKLQKLLDGYNKKLAQLSKEYETGEDEVT